MKNVVITTTIHNPTTLRLYKDADAIIVAGDTRTPGYHLQQLEIELDNMVYLSPGDQTALGYKSSKLIGWNTVQRRNIALLEAIKLHPDIITTIDDDNHPINTHYFSDIEEIFAGPFSGLRVSYDHDPMKARPCEWFNVGAMFDPVFCHRGFPREFPIDEVHLEPVTNANVGVVSGLWLGDPDIDAAGRVVNHPQITYMPTIFEHGIVTQHTFSPFNSQNTAFRAELAPLMMCLPEDPVARYNDIWMSYIAEKVMADFDYYVHYGRPFVWQERNPHTFQRDLQREAYGIAHTVPFCNRLAYRELPQSDLLTKLAYVYEQFSHLSTIGRAWIEDVEKVL